MKKTKQKGFALVLVIVAMAIIGLEMHVLSSGANTMMYQSNRAYLEACKRNLISSGQAWAKQNIRNNNVDIFEKSVELDIGKLNMKDSSLTVTITIPPDKEPQAQINTSCSRSRQTFKSDKIYQIKL
ncbi:MAG: type II secretion system protein [Sedimentisphaerales bacterium]|nr:type II secretion system protein [Sedimentisphaerales bacterium]